MAGHVGLDGYAITWLEAGDGRMDRNDLAGRFVAEDVIVLNDHRANATGVPEMDV
jgi:hypothetical protein